MIDTLVKYLESGEDAVIIYDKASEVHKDKTIYRKYRSFGKIPEFDSSHPKSYMFRSSKTTYQDAEIPLIFQPYIIDIKRIDTRYNQFVFNLYKTGENFIEPHSDCDKDMLGDYNILILSLGATRTLRFTGREGVNGSFEVSPKHGEILVLNKFLNKAFRHELLKSDTKEPRISITARQMR